jgi:dethiobiotin synthetase
MTCRLIRQAKLKLAGLVINGYEPDSIDESMATNPRWLARQNRTKVLATVPQSPGVEPQNAKLPPAVLESIAMVDWQAHCRPPQRRRR